MRIDPKTRNIWETLIALEVWKLLDCVPFPDERYNLVEGHVGRTNILLWDLKGTPVPSDSAVCNQQNVNTSSIHDFPSALIVPPVNVSTPDDTPRRQDVGGVY